MLHYILQVMAFQLLFLLGYDLFLKKETFFNWNRIYLLLTPILSLILPSIQVDAIRQQIPENYIEQLPAVLIGTSKNEMIFTSETIATNFDFGWQHLWYIGMIVATLIAFIKLLKLFKLKQKGRVQKNGNNTLVILPNTDVAFTFFNFIFLGDQLEKQQRETILQHELVHAQQYHTIDLLFFEMLRIIFWFNPLIYGYQNRVAMLQEYIADAAVANSNPKSAYYQSLLSQVFNTTTVSFTNTFFKHSYIKNRITMIQKSKSKKRAQLKYLVIVPLILGMLVYTSCSDDKATEEEANQTTDTEVMTKINELSEAIMKKGNLTEDEKRALQFLATEAKPGDKVYENIDQYLEEKTQTESLPFAMVEKVPIYPGCEGETNEALKKCMSKAITEHIVANFNSDIAKDKNLSGKQRITVQFKIDKNGSVSDIKSRAEIAELEAEATRVVNLLPKMTPGQNDGKDVAVLYSLPIIFEINE